MNTTGTGATRRLNETGTTQPAQATGPAGTGTADTGAGNGTDTGTDNGTGTGGATDNGVSSGISGGTDSGISGAISSRADNGMSGGPSGGAGGGAVVAWDLAAEPRAASRARALTAGALREWRVSDPGDVGDVVLMVDELVTNAVVHGAGPVRLALRLDGRRLLAEVGDGDPSAPAEPAEPRVLDWSEAGRGLLLVAALAAEHGARPEAAGKTVWFTRLLNPLGGHHPAAR